MGVWKWKRKASVVLFVPHPLRKIISTVFFFVFLDAVVVVIPLHGPPHVLAVDDVEGHRIRLLLRVRWRKSSRECANVKNTNLLCSFVGP